MDPTSPLELCKPFRTQRFLANNFLDQVEAEEEERQDLVPGKFAHTLELTHTHSHSLTHSHISLRPGPSAPANLLLAPLVRSDRHTAHNHGDEFAFLSHSGSQYPRCYRPCQQRPSENTADGLATLEPIQWQHQPVRDRREHSDASQKAVIHIQW